MAPRSGRVHVTRNPALFIASDPGTSVGGWLYLWNMNEETDCPAYIGDENIEAGQGIVIPSGPYPGRLPVSIWVDANWSPLYAVSDKGKDCWVGYLKMP